MAEDLLPCPFCGGAAELTWACLVRDTYWWVICPNAECVVRCSGFQSLSKSDAIAAWNRRAALPRADRAEIVEEWHPISTAPKDADILVWARDRVYVCRWDDDRFTRRPHPYWNYSTLGKTWCRDEEPTHWRPLPDPPRSLKAKAGG